MTERDEFRERWWLLSILAALVVGYGFAVHRLGLGTGSGAVVLQELEQRALPSPSKASLEDYTDHYLTVKELEQLVPLCGKSLRQEIAQGRLKHHRLRGKVTVKGSDAIAWLSARREG